LCVLWAVIFCFAVTNDKGIRKEFILQFLCKKKFICCCST